MNSSAARNCVVSSRTRSRTTTFVSTARMPLANVFPNRVLNVRRRPLFHPFGKERVVNIFAAEPPDPADDNSVPLLVPFQYGTGADAEFPANLGRHRNLALRGHT